ncbi:imidazoleglycerol-phosphate dehydratase [Marivivens niveibacter]|uniref:Imidazoleglycerol-phosphate dehydratase n=1 Tax=Marivivens niveibacter TaxID=1930667 RepID=A0A251WYX1_9RHOB|nr:DUF2147 domain-containing protein [Marivivens niveibacter]OUD09335.1 imidazoleglycerol-phosphate dehydratase [Marivivens niveibacter]
MKKLLLGAAFAVLSAGAAIADPLEGNWRTAADDNGNSGLITVEPCGAALCGTLVKAFDASGAEIATENVGRQLIWDTTANGDGTYSGKVYSPDRDKTYNSKLVLSGNSLSVSGCVLGICREGGVWTRN